MEKIYGKSAAPNHEEFFSSPRGTRVCQSFVGRFFQMVWLPVAALLATSCESLTSRQITNPAPAVARLRAGGSLRREADKLAQPLIDSGEIVGMAVGVLTPDGKTHTYGYGRTGIPGRTGPPDGDTIFQIGSVSKLFLTAVLAQLVNEGELDYHDTLKEILPPNTPLGEGIGDITLLELATNTSGFPRQPVCWKQFRDLLAYVSSGKNIYAYIDRDYLFRYLRTTRLNRERKGNYVYSNIGYGLLAHLIEIKTGRKLPDLLEEKICRPLGLHDTTFVLNAEQTKRLAVGHAGQGPRFKPRGSPVKPWDMGEIMKATGAMYSTVNDLMKFTKTSLGMQGQALASVLISTQQPQLSFRSEEIALGWLINYPGNLGPRITYKQGVVGGSSSYIGMDTEQRCATIVLYNTFMWEDKVGQDLLMRLSLSFHHNKRKTPVE